jgi:hypothetical protein
MKRLLMENQSPDHVLVTRASERIEAVAGVLIAVFASLLAISDLVGSNYEEEKYKCEIKHNEYFNWYQSKSMKQTMLENQLGFIQLLSLQGSIKSTYADSMVTTMKKEIGRYKKDKNEILLGSSKISKEDWSQDIDGRMGEIIGVKEWEIKSAKLETAISKFDLSQLFFQICLVIGATCIVIYDNPRLQNLLLKIMIFFGVVGVGFALYGWILGG